jgi:hypothetical protein
MVEAQKNLELTRPRSWLREQFGTGGQAHLERLPREATRALPRSPLEGDGTPSMELAGARQFASFGVDSLSDRMD